MVLGIMASQHLSLGHLQKHGMASIDALKQSFHSSDHEMFLEPYCLCSNSAFSNTSMAPSNYEALQYSPQSHNHHMSSHIVNDINHILDSPSTHDNMITFLQQEDSCMLLSDIDTVPASSALIDPIMICDIWPLQADATHNPNYVSHTPLNDFSFQDYLQLPPTPSAPMDTTQANSTDSATMDDTDTSTVRRKHSTWKYFAKKPIIRKPFTLSSSSSELQRSIQLKPGCNTRGRKENAKKVDNIEPRMPKNLASDRIRRKTSDRSRRKKLNEKLYSLRALIPNISKMDKASIVSDGIEHVQNLQKQVALCQQEISSLQLRLDASSRGALSTNIDDELSMKHHRRVSSCSIGYPQHEVLKMDVVKVEEETYELRLECAKGKWGVLQLTRALEALHFDILSANHTSIGGRFLTNVVLQAKMLKSKELRDIILEILPKFGLISMRKRW